MIASENNKIFFKLSLEISFQLFILFYWRLINLFILLSTQKHFKRLRDFLKLNPLMRKVIV